MRHGAIEMPWLQPIRCSLAFWFKLIDRIIAKYWLGHHYIPCNSFVWKNWLKQNIYPWNSSSISGWAVLCWTMWHGETLRFEITRNCKKCCVMAVASASNINIWCFHHCVLPRRFRETAWYSEWHPQNICRLLAVDLTSMAEISNIFLITPVKKGKP